MFGIVCLKIYSNNNSNKLYTMLQTLYINEWEKLPISLMPLAYRILACRQHMTSVLK